MPLAHFPHYFNGNDEFLPLSISQFVKFRPDRTAKKEAISLLDLDKNTLAIHGYHIARQRLAESKRKKVPKKSQNKPISP